MAEVEVGVGKSARRGYELDDVAIVASRRTRDAADVDLSWQLDAFRLDLPLMVGVGDAIVSPSTATEIDRLGGLAVLDLEGLWTRYGDPGPHLEALAELDDEACARRLVELYGEPVHPELVTEVVARLSDAGVVTCGALSWPSAAELAGPALEGDLDVLLVQARVLSAEHVSKGGAPLDLSGLIRELDIPVVVGGCASYQAALHLMRTGAVGVLVGTGLEATSSVDRVLGLGVPGATAIADAAGARTRHLEETGVYVHVVAGGRIETSGDIAKALACGADAVMAASPFAAATDAPGRGRLWSAGATQLRLAALDARTTATRGALEQILLGPAADDSGTTNLFGAVRESLGACGYASVREFHKADIVVSPGSRAGS